MLVYEPHWYSKHLTLAIAMSCEFNSDLPFPHLRSGMLSETSKILLTAMKLLLSHIVGRLISKIHIILYINYYCSLQMKS